MERPVSPENRKKTVRMVRLVRKTSFGKLTVALAIGLLVGCFLGIWISQITSELRYQDANRRVDSEYQARLHAEEKMYQMHLDIERLTAEKEAGAWHVGGGVNAPGPDLSRVNAVSSDIAGSGANDDLLTISEETEEEAREWKSRYRYAAIKFNKLASDYAKLHKKYIELTGAGGATKGLITGEQFYRFLRGENKEKLDRCWDEKKKSLRLWERKRVEEDERIYTDRDSWLRRMAIRIGIEKV